MKTQEYLNKLKDDYVTLTTKLRELTEDELEIVTGGSQYFSYYIEHGERVSGYSLQVGDYFVDGEVTNGGTLEIYRLDRKDNCNAITTKYVVSKGKFPNYTIESNVSIILNAAYSRIYKPDWIIE